MNPSRLAVGFAYTSTLRDASGRVLSCEVTRNVFPLQGRNHILDSAIGGATQIPAWRVGLFKGNYAPSDADVMSTFPGAAVEVTGYSEVSRGLLVPNPANAGVLNTVGRECIFTLTADALIYGGFIASGAGKGSTTGVLLSAARFQNPQQGFSGQTVTVGAVCTLINV